jgi:hypothetical protein
VGGIGDDGVLLYAALGDGAVGDGEGAAGDGTTGVVDVP